MAAAVRSYALLLVDDEALITETMKLFLEEGIQLATVDLAPSAEEALARLRAQPYDMVISDHQLPGKSGMALLRDVARDHPATMRVLLTGATDPLVASEAVQGAGIHGYIQKPYSRKRVVDMVRTLLYSRVEERQPVSQRTILEAMGRSRTSRWRSAASQPAEGPEADADLDAFL